MSTRTRIRKSFELSILERLSTPAVTVVGSLGGYTLKVATGETTVAGLATGALVGVWAGGLAFAVTRLEEIDDSSVSSQTDML